jgi:hypothetical protein
LDLEDFINEIDDFAIVEQRGNNANSLSKRERVSMVRQREDVIRELKVRERVLLEDVLQNILLGLRIGTCEIVENFQVERTVAWSLYEAVVRSRDWDELLSESSGDEECY